MTCRYHRPGFTLAHYFCAPFQQDSYSPGAALLLAQETGASDAKDHWAGFKEAWTSQKGNEHVVTSPKG